MEEDNYNWSSETLKLIGHVQVSNSFLKPLSELADENKLKYKKQISDIINLGYKGSISLEMIESSIGDLINSINMFQYFILS
jgi:hypothetical protein